jgi:uncharacterized short protein YbdD (DUF466 family)
MQLIRKWWNMLAQIMGEGEYARYCEHARLKHPGMRVQTAGEFYVSRLNEKYSRPHR